MIQSFKNVLLVEDDPASLFLLQHLLLELSVGESIEVARNGAEAFAYLESLAATFPADAPFTDLNALLPDLLLVDISMPVMDGLEFLEKYHKVGYAQVKPSRIVLVTSSTYQRDIERSKSLGIFAYLVKPVTKGALLFALRTIQEEA